MIATSHNMEHGALRTIMIHKKNIETNGCSLTDRGLVNMDIGLYITNEIVYFVSDLTEISKKIPLSIFHLWFKISAWRRTGVM